MIFSLLAVIFIAACNKTEDGQPVQMKDLKLNFTGLENLGLDFTYEGWIIVDGNPVSTGTFTVDDNGNYSKSTFSVNAESLDKATKFVLTIEPFPDSNPAPSDVHILAGDFTNNAASLSVGDGAALGDDFSTLMGNYILATPTTNTKDDELSGVWFLDLSSGMPSVGLMNLPALPNGWIYEGWVVTNGMPVTSGKFSFADMEDDSAPYSGSDELGPPFPGEDYVMNAPAGHHFPTSLASGKAVISIEPVPDNSTAPFGLKPLVGDIPAGAADHMTYSMDNMSSGFPSGTASR